MLPPGSYVLFLTDTGHSMYTVASGMAGEFPISNGLVSRDCPNYEDPRARVRAAGSGLAVDAFDQLVRSAKPEKRASK